MNPEKIENFLNLCSEKKEILSIFDVELFTIKEADDESEGVIPDGAEVKISGNLNALDSFLSRFINYFQIENLSIFCTMNGSPNEKIYSYSFFSFVKLFNLFIKEATGVLTPGFETRDTSLLTSDLFYLFSRSDYFFDEDVDLPSYYLLLLDLLEEKWNVRNGKSFSDTFLLNKKFEIKQSVNNVANDFFIGFDEGETARSFLMNFFTHYSFLDTTEEFDYPNILFKKELDEKEVFFYSFAVISNSVFSSRFNSVLSIENKLAFIDAVKFFLDKADSINVPEAIISSVKNTTTSSDNIFNFVSKLYSGLLYLTSEEVDKIKDKKIEEDAKKKIKDADKLVDNIESYEKADSFSKFAKLKDAFKIAFLMSKNQKDSIKELNKIYTEIKNKNVPELLDSELCSWILLTVYSMFFIYKDDRNLLTRMSDTSELNKLKEEFKKESFVKQIPGYLNTTQSINVGWEPMLGSLNNDVSKIYANFYNFFTGLENPYSEYLNDEKYNTMQSKVLQGRKDFIGSLNEDKYLEKIQSYFYDPRTDRNGNKKSSIYNLIKNGGNLFAELEDPLEFKAYAEGLSFSLDISAMLVNSCLEMASSAILEVYLSLFEKKFIKFKVIENGKTVTKELSISDIYFELITITKILELSSGKNISLSDLKAELEKINENILTPDPSKPNSILYFLDSEGYFALTGTTILGSSGIDSIKSALGITGKGSNAKETNFLKQLSSKTWYNSYTVYSKNKDYWFLFQYLKNRNLALKSNNCFYNITFLTKQINSLTDAEKCFCFLMSIKERISVTSQSQNTGEIDVNATINAFNASVSSNAYKIPIGKTSHSETLFDYYSCFQTFYFKETSLLRNLIDSCSRDSLFSSWQDGINSAAINFSKAASDSRKRFSELAVNKNLTPVLDTLARMLPTTSLLYKNFGINLSPMLNKLRDWIDLSMDFTLHIIKTFLAEYKKDINESYELIRIQLFSYKYSNRIYSMNLFLDCLVEAIPKYQFCLTNNLLTPEEVSFGIYSDYKAKEAEKKSSSSSDSNNSNPITGSNIDLSKSSNNYISDPTTSGTSTSKQDLIRLAIAGAFNDQKVSFVSDNNDGTKSILIGGLPIDQVPIVRVESDYDVFVALEKNKNGVVLQTPTDLVVSDFVDFITPQGEKINSAAISQIVASYKVNSLASIGLNSKDNVDSGKLKETVAKLNLDNGISYSDAGYITGVDFTKANATQLFDSIGKFNYNDFIDYTFTNHKILESNSKKESDE